MTEDIPRYTTRDLATFAAAITSRLQLARSLGQTAYEGDRDYNLVLGYPDAIEFGDFLTRFERQDIAERVVSLPPKDTWKRPPQISENDDTETLFVRAWEAMATRLKVWNILTRVDILSGIGKYGVVLIGVRDGQDLAAPIQAGSLKGPDDILFLRPFSEGSATIHAWEADAANERFGLPKNYRIKVRDDAPEVSVHWTRILHVAEGKLDSEIFGTPRLRSPYNRLDDLTKVVGGGAEAAWLGMRPGTQLVPTEGYKMPDEDDTTAQTAIDTEIRRYAHDPLRFLKLEGVEAKQIGAGQVLDPSGQFEMLISLIAAASDMPQRVLLGSAAGELSAAQEDTRQWFSIVSSRQTNYAEPEILRPLIDRFQWYGALPPTPTGYEVGTLDENGVRRWPSLFELTDVERAKLTLDRANATKALADPFTGELPITEDEARELLGYPPEEENTVALAMNQARYRAGIKSPVRALWNGTFTRGEFITAMGTAIELGLRRAWLQGAREAGVREVELTPEEEARIREVVFQQQLSVDDFGAFIEEHNRASGGLLRSFNPRIDLWSNAFLSVKAEAMQTAVSNPKLMWNVISQEPCISARKLSGKVKRASQWEAAGIRPQSQQLQCMIDAGGPNVCKCFFSVTDEPLSRGRLPSIP